MPVSNGTGEGNQVKEFSLSATLTYANSAPSNITIKPDAGHEGVTEDLASAMVASGRVAATDTDVTSSGAKDADSLSFSIVDSDGKSTDMVTDKDYGTLIMDKNGSYEFHLNTSSPVVQQLGAGDSKDITFTIQVSDNHGGVSEATLPITIKGSNDAPVISLHHVTINGGTEVLGAAGSGAYGSLTHNGSSGFSVGS